MGWDFTNLIKAREVLDSLWKESMLRGRCWGIGGESNPFARSNITIASRVEDRIELVSISQTKEGTLKVHEFTISTNTDLGNLVKKLLEEGELIPRKE